MIDQEAKLDANQAEEETQDYDTVTKVKTATGWKPKEQKQVIIAVGLALFCVIILAILLGTLLPGGNASSSPKVPCDKITPIYSSIKEQMKLYAIDLEEN